MYGRTSIMIDVASCPLSGIKILDSNGIQNMHWMCPCTLLTEIIPTWMQPKKGSPSENSWMANSPSFLVGALTKPVVILV